MKATWMLFIQSITAACSGRGWRFVFWCLFKVEIESRALMIPTSRDVCACDDV